MQRSNGNNNTVVAHPACASCKHQRKKCAEDCVLAPYFPAARSREFQAVHRVFGVSNVAKLVKSVREEDRKSVADSLVWEACCRQNDPILGPLGEFRKIQEELKLYKAQKQTQNHHHHQLGQQSLMFSNSNNHHANWNVNGNSYDNGIIVDPSSFINNYPINNPNNGNNNYVLGLEKARKQEKDLGHCIVPLHSQPQQQLSVNQQHQYYLSGQFGSSNGKTMENSLWEAAGQ